MIAYDPKYTASMNVREKRDLPCIQNRSKVRFLGSESKNQDSEKNVHQLNFLSTRVKVFR